MTLLIFWAALRCLAGADPNTGIVRGYVRSEDGDGPVCGVRVYAISSTESTWSTLTDEHGFFVFLALFPGIATLNAQTPRGEQERNVQVSANRYSELTLYVNEVAAQGFSRCRGKRIEDWRGPIREVTGTYLPF